jgi:hypothetical protein
MDKENSGKGKNREPSATSNGSERSTEKTSNGPTVSSKRAGTGDFLAKSTKETHSSALKWFSTFLKETGRVPFEDLKEEDVTLDLLQHFGGYFIEKADTATKLDEMLKGRTAQQYISGVTGELAKRFPSLQSDLDEKGPMYTKLRSDVYRNISRACIRLVRSS